MTCDRIREQLTAYLDGDLDADRGTVVRGHLRGCDDCRKVAEAEAALRDELRALPPLDPPASLWSGVQARLAQAEVAEASRPAWRRALARWAPRMPRVATGGLIAAAAASVLWWRVHRDVESPPPSPPQPPIVHHNPPPVIVPSHEKLDCILDPDANDVSVQLLDDASRVTACWQKAAEDLVAAVKEDSARWSEAQRKQFDTEVTALRARAVHAQPGKARQRAYRAMLTYARTALTRDQLAMAGEP